MISLAIDIGNTRAKAAAFNGTEQVDEVIIDDNTLISFIKKHQPEYAVLSSVGKHADEISEIVKKENIKLLTVNYQTNFPFIIDYKTPETLGMDRLAGIAAAQFIYPKQNVLVIDAGTCITYDFLEQGKAYRGGAIAPGLKMRLKAMHEFTTKLPKPELITPGDFEGKSTTESLLSGVVCAAADEIKGRIARYSERYGNIQPVLCGGDSLMLAEQLKNNIFAAPSLIMTGLNQILLFNVNKG